MVDNFSNFARLPQPEPKPADLVGLCRRAAELEQARFAQHKITFATSLAEATAVVDEDLLRQVLINLVKNAGEACGDASCHITVSLSRASSDWVIDVKDDGPGIPPEVQGRIFEAYFTTKHTGPSPGMGLGLAVCQKIVMDHGGKMDVRSRPGETVFSIRLPRGKAKA
jgi:signal transduction histidine kinase